MEDEIRSLDEEPMLILTYLDAHSNRYNIDGLGKLRLNGERVTPYGIEDGIKYLGINDHSMLELKLFEELERKGFDMRRMPGKTCPLKKALRQDPETFMKATYDICTRDSVARVPYEDAVDYINRRMSIVAVNRKVTAGFFTPPLFSYAWTDQELSDISVEVMTPHGIITRKKRRNKRKL